MSSTSNAGNSSPRQQKTSIPSRDGGSSAASAVPPSLEPCRLPLKRTDRKGPIRRSDNGGDSGRRLLGSRRSDHSSRIHSVARSTPGSHQPRLARSCDLMARTRSFRRRSRSSIVRRIYQCARRLSSVSNTSNRIGALIGRCGSISNRNYPEIQTEPNRCRRVSDNEEACASAMDIGGTFTDLIALRRAAGTLHDRQDADDARRAGSGGPQAGIAQLSASSAISARGRRADHPRHHPGHQRADRAQGRARPR